jgi:glycosyltransferase involved in cell wall biosynthesis
MGFEVTLVGRKLPDSLPVAERPYNVIRFQLPWQRGPLFYIAYALRLFYFLLMNKADLLYANDLDTLLSNFYCSRIKNSRLIYDSHEYFTGVPELVRRPRKQAVWKKLERHILPRLKSMITVNQSIATMYRGEYGIDVTVIRNVPLKGITEETSLSRADFNIPEDKSVFLFQGAGINVDRGAEEAVEAISLVPEAVLLFIGGGDVLQNVKSLVERKKLEDRVFFIPKQPMSKLRSFTRLADFGLSLDKATNINYRFSLPNKLFDYLHAGLPVLVTALPEVERIVTEYNVGMVIPDPDPATLAEAMRQMITHPLLRTWQDNTVIAAGELSWENEKQKLISFVTNVVV